MLLSLPYFKFGSLLRPAEVDADVQQQERPHRRENDPLQVRRLRGVTAVASRISRFFPAFSGEKQQENPAGVRGPGTDTAVGLRAKSYFFF